jgi:hypothetical protein
MTSLAGWHEHDGHEGHEDASTFVVFVFIVTAAW